ncbi:MAG: 50S ribosomal protein L4 [Alphaproteobacteria bacterium]|nr:50S ribosomal protein L4 [Alphaproteobacteria bacterium]MDP1670568.1 50S ribosomal protein L4 [Alphaproteobacteria bacterium]
MKAEVKNLDAGNAGDIELADAIFALEPRADILHRVVVWQLAKRRAGTHKVKIRSEIKMTTKKFGRQKGGGTARHGARSANIFRGGGVAHGPVPRSHATDLQKKVRKLALRHALSAKLQDESLFVVEDTKLSTAKTSGLREKLIKLGFSNALFIDGAEVDANFLMAVRNIPHIDVLPSQGANVYDILRHDKLVLTRAAVAQLEARLK